MAAAKTTSQAPSAEPEQPDLDTIAPDEGSVTVAGVSCRVKRLRMRELMALVRVLTRGMGGHMGEMSWSSDNDEFGQQLLGLALVGIPEAVDETAELVQLLVEPKALDESNAVMVRAELDNPDIDVLIDIISTVVEQERESFELLLGKLRTLTGAAGALARKNS